MKGTYVEVWTHLLPMLVFPFLYYLFTVRLERIMAKVIDSLDELKKMLSNDMR